MPTPSRWLEKRRRDQYYKMAKAKGYRSRAAWKLKEAIRSYRFIKPGDVVVDLGSAPGGWLQVARELVGAEGYVVGVDIVEIEPLPFENVAFLKLDIMSPEAEGAILSAAGGKVDVVLSDASPKTSGAWDVDQARQIRLARRSLEIAKRILKKGGHFFVKAYQGSELDALIADMKGLFKAFRLVKPPASRPESSEIYLLGLSFKGQGV